MYFKIFQDSQENTSARVSFKKETMPQVLSCESWEIIENIIFTEHPRVAASANKRFKKRMPSETEAAIGDVL